MGSGSQCTPEAFLHASDPSVSVTGFSSRECLLLRCLAMVSGRQHVRGLLVFEIVGLEVLSLNPCHGLGSGV